MQVLCFSVASLGLATPSWSQVNVTVGGQNYTIN